MQRIWAGSIAALVVWAGFAAVEARADDGPITRETIHEEVEAYLKDHNKGNDIRWYWKDGLRWDAWNGKFKGKFGGRIQADYWFFDDVPQAVEDVTGDFANSGFQFRRARLFVEGEMWDSIKWKVQYDFAGDVDFKDVWIAYDTAHCFGCMMPLIQVGHFKEPFSLEELTSSKYDTFMEQSLPVEAFAPSRSSGVMLKNSFRGEQLFVALGFFGNGWHYDTDPSDSDSAVGSFDWDDGYAVTGRICWTPWAPCGCDHRYLMLGVSASYRGDMDVGGRTHRFRARPGARTDERAFQTGRYGVEDMFLVDAEIAWTMDRFHMSGEYICAMVNASEGVDDPTYSGYYVTAGYFLNGPGRRMKRSGMVHDRVKPCCNFLDKDCCCKGAFEVAARYSYLDLQEGADPITRGGEGSTITVGLNWYLNPNAVIRLNYVYADIESAHGEAGANGDSSAVGIRFQIDW